MTPKTSQTICQTITLDFDEEMVNTRKLLERVPLDDKHRGYKPHEKSMSLEALASHVAMIPSWPEIALESEVFELREDFESKVAKSTAELLEMFDKSVKVGRATLDGATDSEMAKDWTFTFGDKFSMKEPRTKVIRGFINHLVHHRAQLGVYLRMNNIPVPGMYGPSADEAA
jgi:uncharacterized damage-inducible protein DinB